MATSKGSSDQDIGRPGPWREGRYQQAEKPADQSVRTPPGSSSNDTPVSTPVTRRDYIAPDQEPPESGDREPPGGDAG